MMWDKKKTLEAIMSRKRNADGGEIISGPTPLKQENVSDEQGEPDVKHLAAQDLMEAFHSKSPDRLNKSMANYIDLHMSKSSDDKPEPQE